MDYENLDFENLSIEARVREARRLRDIAVGEALGSAFAAIGRGLKVLGKAVHELVSTQRPLHD